MQVDDRVSYKTVQWREGGLNYVSQVCRFGASDAIMLDSIHVTIETLPSNETCFVGVALSRNPGHELNPPGEIAAYFADESLYARCAWINLPVGTSFDSAMLATRIIPMHDLIVPSRQIATLTQIIAAMSIGIVMEIYYHEVKLSREEANLMNLTWGKYRR